MSRRNQSRRRRTYGRRQHEVRERRPDAREGGLLGSADFDVETEWQSSEGDERSTYESYGSFGR
jgi:hypothetical protein